MENKIVLRSLLLVGSSGLTSCRPRFFPGFHRPQASGRVPRHPRI